MQHLQPNSTLQGGKYRIERVLGQGGFGNTYAGTNTVFDERVAIKEFFMQGINDRDGDTGSVSVSLERNKQQFEEQREKFKKEALRIRKLNNPHIIKVHDLFEENGTAYYVMDYVDGENLAERLKRTGQPFAEKEANQILPQILDALKSVHDAGIWHLDLKPANIMIDKAGNITLIDFGASKQFNAQKGGATTSTAISYTNGYAPREQMEQNYDKFGPWTDFYALGATLYTLLTNKRPPLPTDIDDDISEDKHIALPFPSIIGEKMRKCVLWLMNTNRNLRPQNVEELNKWIDRENADDFDLEQLLEKAKSGDVESGEILSEYLFNDSNSEDKQIVFDWFKEIAEQGDEDVQFSVAVCYKLGKGTARNLKEAAQWFQKSAEQGNVDAQHELGLCYYTGEGVDKDFFEAKRWIKKAADNGNEESKEWLESIQNENDINEETIMVNSQNEETIIDAPPIGNIKEKPTHIDPQITNPRVTNEVKTDKFDLHVGNVDKNDNNKKDSSKNIGWIVLVAFFLIIILGGIYFSNYQSNNYAQPEVAFEDTALVVDTMAVDTAAVNIYDEEGPITIIDIETNDTIHGIIYKSILGKYLYEGALDSNNQPNGLGEATFEDGRYYKGNFEFGNLIGDNAYFKYPNGDEFRGSFRNNAFYKGTYTIAEDGSYFEGTFKNGQPDKGHWYDKNGNLIE